MRGAGEGEEREKKATTATVAACAVCAGAGARGAREGQPGLARERRGGQLARSPRERQRRRCCGRGCRCRGFAAVPALELPAGVGGGGVDPQCRRSGKSSLILY